MHVWPVRRNCPPADMKVLAPEPVRASFAREIAMKRAAKWCGVCAACALVIVLAACNTSKGVGKDLEKAGEGVQKSAEKHGAD